MTHRLPMLLWPGLLLVCCDKPGEADTRKGESAAAPRVARGGHAPRPSPAGSMEELRTTLNEAGKIEKPEARDKALAEVAWNALELDPELAREAFQQLPADSAEKIRLIQHSAMRLAEQNVDEALAWAATLGSERESAAAYGQIALFLAETDPQRAANLLSESGVAGRAMDVATVEVIQRWAAKSPPDAAAWVELFPPGAAREAGFKTIMNEWTKTAAPAAMSWLGALQDPAIRNEAALAMEETLLQQPQQVRDDWLQHADDRTRTELQQLESEALKEVGDNVPPPAK